MSAHKRENHENNLTIIGPLRWGRPPLALVPGALARLLASVSLPSWLAGLLGEPATAAALTADVWNRLPEDDSVREQAAGEALRMVASHASEVRGARIGRPLDGGLECLALSHWPTRARHAVLSSEVGSHPDRLATLCFGDVLELREVGIQTALEVAALLELLLPDDVEPGSPRNAESGSVGASGGECVAVAHSAMTAARWGHPDSPLLPQALRRALATETLPGWLLEDLHLPPDATPLALDSSVWRRIDRLPPRAERFLLGLVTYRVEDLRELRIINSSWPRDVPPDAAPWPTRVRNALLRADLLDVSRLEQLSFGDLLALPAMGVKSTLEFAAVAECLAQGTPAGVLDEGMRQDLVTAAEEEWAERVRTNDPRFRDVAPPYSGSLNHLFEEALNNPEGSRALTLAEAVPRIRTRAQEIASEPIDVALVRLLRSLRVSERDVAIVVARLGWRAGGPHTLQEVGDEFSMTRERVRQIVMRAKERMGPTYLPQIERAIQLIADRAPITGPDAARLLVELGLSTAPIEPVSLRDAAELLGYEVTFQIDPGDGVPYVLAQGQARTGPVFTEARRQAGRVGVTNIEEVQAELEASGHDFTTDAVSRILHSSTKIEFVSGEWFWMPDIPAERNRLRNVTQRMLSVMPQLDVPTLRQGVRRRYRFMQIDLVPPIDVMTAFYTAHPEFVVRDDGSVESSMPLDYRDTLGDVEQVFVGVLRAAPTGLMDRSELDQAVTGRGVNPSTFSVFTSYSPILDHPAVNVWCLRGHPVDPAKLEALLAVVATRSRQRRTLAYGWDEEGGLRLTVVIGNVSSPVIGIPSSIVRYVAGRQFSARTQEGTSAGVVAVDEGGASWGYGPFLRRRGAEMGDALTLCFDLVTERVTLILGDEAALAEVD